MKIVYFILLTSSLAFSSTKKTTEHRHHGAHAHGEGSLGLAFDGATGKIDFKIPSESILGFEHKVKTSKDKKKQFDSLDKFDSNVAKMIVFDAALKCQFLKEKLEVVFDSKSSKHSDVVAVYNVNCQASPIETTVTFNFKKYFSKIKNIDAQVIVDSLQKSIEISKDGTKLMLGR